jgi:hypothetical protein
MTTTGSGLVTGFLDHLYTQIVTTCNYSVIANLHNLQITRAHAKSSQSAFTSRFLVTEILQLLCSRRCPLANTRTTDSFKVEVKVTLRLAVYCQSVHLDAKPLEDEDQRFFSTGTLR